MAPTCATVLQALPQAADAPLSSLLARLPAATRKWATAPARRREAAYAAPSSEMEQAHRDALGRAVPGEPGRARRQLLRPRRPLAADRARPRPPARQLDDRLPIVALLQHPTVRTLARHLAGGREAEAGTDVSDRARRARASPVATASRAGEAASVLRLRLRSERGRRHHRHGRPLSRRRQRARAVAQPRRGRGVDLALRGGRARPRGGGRDGGAAGARIRACPRDPARASTSSMPRSSASRRRRPRSSTPSSASSSKRPGRRWRTPATIRRPSRARSASSRG